MHKKLRITVEGKVYDVIVEDVTEAERVSPHALPGAVASPPASGATPAVPPVPVAATPATPASAQPGDEVSPLSGVVDSVEVAAGAVVTEGDKIVVIEAMKMKTVVYARHSGRVTRISVKPGDAVETGQVLMTIA